MKLKELYSPEKHKHLNLVLLLTKEADFTNNTNISVLAERQFYYNKESAVGYKFNKPISKVLNGKI